MRIFDVQEFVKIALEKIFISKVKQKAEPLLFLLFVSRDEHHQPLVGVNLEETLLIDVARKRFEVRVRQSIGQLKLFQRNFFFDFPFFRADRFAQAEHRGEEDRPSFDARRAAAARTDQMYQRSVEQRIRFFQIEIVDLLFPTRRFGHAERMNTQLRINRRFDAFNVEMFLSENAEHVVKLERIRLAEGDEFLRREKSRRADK